MFVLRFEFWIRQSRLFYICSCFHSLSFVLLLLSCFHWITHETLTLAFSTQNSTQENDYCNRPWPKLELFLPFQAHTNPRHPRFWEVESIFLQTFKLFWPLQLSKTSLVLGFDEEMGNSNHVRTLNSTLESMKQGNVFG